MWFVDLYQEIIKVRELIPHIGPLTKVIPLKLFLHIFSGAPAARRAAKWSPITIGTGSHACIEIETYATLFSW